MPRQSASDIVLADLLAEARACKHCEPALPLGANPVLRAGATARLLIVGQAPGTKVHASGIPWNDPSGDRLRNWMGIDRDTFYNSPHTAIIPMGFCYPGTGKSGDLPPRPECAEAWREKLLAGMPGIELTLVIGQYAHNWHLKGGQKRNLTEPVRAWKDYSPAIIPLPHPSPRNNLWLRRNPWFEIEIVPHLRKQTRKFLSY